jgi:hypothetical protein
MSAMRMDRAVASLIPEGFSADHGRLQEPHEKAAFPPNG